jgi:hypothetical protein
MDYLLLSWLDLDGRAFVGDDIGLIFGQVSSELRLLDVPD